MTPTDPDFNAKVEAILRDNRSWRRWFRGVVTVTFVVWTLFLGLWGLGLEPLAAARTAVGLWCLWVVGLSTALGLLLGLAFVGQAIGAGIRKEDRP